MAEEQRWQEPGGHRLCANNCEFFGSPTTLNLCSKCYKDHCMKEQQMKEAKLAMEKTLTTSESSSYSPPSRSSPSLPESEISVSPEPQKGESSFGSSPSPIVSNAGNVMPRTRTAAQPNRCATCRRRVGLTGFKCRCEITFCGSHRYPEKHGCTFDYKAVGREEIAKANPVVKAEKLDKI